MITDTQKEEALLRYYQRGILKEEVRSYEVSLWTLQDQFMTVLKWSDVEQKGRIEEPKMTLDVDGTQNFTFKIPMYINKWEESIDCPPHLIKIENPIWYNTQNGNLIEGMRKIKVIFNKMTADEKVFEFIIIKVTESHEQDMTMCEVQCEGLAFHELGKVGYKLSLSQDNFELIYKEWAENGSWTKYDGTTANYQPIQTLQYWCEEGAHLIPYPSDEQPNAQTWYYRVEMDWSSFAQSGAVSRDTHKIYEEAYTSAWTSELAPKQVVQYQEKARPVTANQSNLYNITQNIAEQFGVHCRYEFTYDENYQITSKSVVFYNNYNKENEGILGFTYPYSSKTVTRNVDVTDLTTKLYISSIDSDNSLEGVISIMNSPANKIKEDYILNFDYIHKIGGITDEQYDAIGVYEKEIRAINDALIPLQSELEAFQGKKIEVEAKLTTYTNSIKLDKEQIDYNQGLGNALTEQNGDSDGYISITAAAPDSAIIITPEEGLPYINLQHTNKGIDVNSLHIYYSWIPGESRCEEEVKDFKPVTDPNYPDNLIKVEGVPPGSDNRRTVYLVYKYKPKLYYDNIVKTWETKLANDTKNKEDLTEELDNINAHIEDDTAAIQDKILEKDEKIREFEHMMGPALREGYWNPDNYKDYGEVKSNDTLTLPATASSVFTDSSIEDEVIIGWDELLFDDEDKIYYKVGNNQMQVYYPCVNLSSLFSSICNNINEYSFIFNTNYYDSSANLTNTKYIKAFSIGSEALLRFVKDQSNNVYPILVLVGAKNMTDDQLTFMKAQNHGHPRIGIITNTIGEDAHGKPVITTSITGATAVHSSSYWTFGNNSIEQCIQVVPRIKFNNTSVKADTTNLQITYNNQLLEPYVDYQILTRITHYGTSQNPIDHPEYYITLKPETLWKCGTYTGNAKVNYTVANLATSIYVDALEVSKNNAEPKVEYNLQANIVDERILHTLYKELARIIMITDNDLKLEDAFGYISHIELNLDKPEEDSIEIKNYKSKFEDLFSTIVAQTEAMTRAQGAIGDMMSGNIPISQEALSTTIVQQQNIFDAYLDSYFDSSQVVIDKLTGLFTEAGAILGDSNKVLGTAVSLSLENAGILGNFATQVIQELSPKVVKSTTRPADFKVGDIWVELEAIPNTSPVEYREVGRYVATSDSLHSVNGHGYTRTYDGTLSQIVGANMAYDATAGTVDIYGSHEITLRSGEHVYIGAGDSVDIVGNQCVNIGGTTVNIGSTVINNSNVQGGINIVATSYGTEDFEDALVSKVLIHPDEIYMAGSQITMLTGTGSDAVSAIKIDGRTVENDGAEYGIWLGSNKGIRLFSGNPTVSNNQTTYGANVELLPSHLLMGVTNGADATAVEMTENYVVIAAGNANRSLSVTGTGSGLIGAKFTKNSIGLATSYIDESSNTTKYNAILMNNLGITIGTGSIDVTAANLTASSGSYVRISGGGIEVGSLANLYLNTQNVKLQTDSSYGTRFALGTNLQNTDNVSGVSSSTIVGLVYNTNGLFIRGNIYADNGTFNGTVNASTFIATSNRGKFIADGNKFGLYKTDETIGILTISTDTMTVASNYTLSISGNLNISSNNLQINSNPRSSGQNYFYVGDDINNSPTKYIKYTQGGVLEIKGDITATSFTLTGTASGISYNDLTDKPTIPSASDFTVDGLGYVTDWASTGKNYVTLTSTGGLLIGGNINNGTGNSIIIPSSADSAANPYLKIDENGIELNGKHIKINGKQEWSRDDIFYSPSVPSSYPTDREWIWIKPNYNTFALYQRDNISQFCNYQNNDAEITAYYDGDSAQYITSGTAQNGTQYEYEITITATFGVAISEYNTQVYSSTGFAGEIGIDVNNRFAFSTPSISSIRGYANDEERVAYTFKTSGLTSSINLRNSTSISSIQLWLRTTRDDNNGRPAYIKSVTIKEKADKVLGGTLCDIFYYESGAHP